MKLKFSLKKVIFVALLISALSAGLSTYLLFKHSEAPQKQKSSDLSQKIATYTTKEPEKTAYNILLLGYGGATHSGGGLSDALILAHVDTLKKKVSLIAIPRDIWVEIPIRSDKKESHKINAAFAIGNDEKSYPLKEPIYQGPNGGGNMVMHSVEEVTGLKPDFYAALDFDRFVRSIDALKGIKVNVPTTFTDDFYPIKGLENESCGFTPEQMDTFKIQYSGFELEKQYTCRYEKLHFDKGLVNMDGATALKFIRSRHSNEHGGDFARGEREQAVLLAIRDKLLSLDAIKNIDDFYEEFRGLIVTDIKEEDILEFLSHVLNPADYTTEQINITTDNYLQNSVSSDGQYILIPKVGINNWTGVHKFLENKLK